MAINFPATPTVGDTFTQDDTTWVWDGVAWNLAASGTGKNVFSTIDADVGATTADAEEDTLVVAGGTDISTTIVGDTLTIDFTGSLTGATDAFKTIVTDDGQYTATGEDTLNILGRTNISTELTTDTNDLHIDLDPFSIDFLSDVDTSTNAPTTGQVLKWDGSQWAPGNDATSGGTGLDADTLDGFDSAYFLNYNNLANTPNVATLTDFSIGNELTAAGNGAISYDNTTGVFRYTPPTAAGLGALTEVAINDVTDININNLANNDLLHYNSADSEWQNVTIADAGFSTVATSGSYTDLSNTPTIPADISDLTDTTNIIPESILDLNITDGTNGQVLTTDGNGVFTFTTVSSGGATQNLFETISGDTGSTTANSATDTLTIAGGTSITTSVVGDTLTVNYSGASGVTSFDQLTDAQTANLATIDDFVVRSGMHFEVDNIGATAYTFPKLYGTAANPTTNPTIYVLSGMQVSFKLNTGGHPFEIQDNTLTALTENLLHIAEDGTVSADSQAQAKDGGTLIWTIPENGNGTYVYQCTLHPAMYGQIIVKRLSTL
jgi:plastocyanin